MKTKRISVILAVVLLLSAIVVPSSALGGTAFQVENNYALSKEIAKEGFVLLRNESQALPLQPTDTVTVFGARSFNNNSSYTGFLKGGQGSGNVTSPYTIDVPTGLAKMQERGLVSVYTGNDKFYYSRVKLNPLDMTNKEIAIGDDKVQEAAKNANTAVITLGRWSSELFDHEAKAGDYYLGDGERKLLDQVTKAGFEKIVVLVNIGSQMDMSWVADYPEIDSVLLVWYPGQEGGHAIAETLVGLSTPSGKLPNTFASSYQAYPSSSTFAESEDYVNYTEDIFVGYRYFETFDPEYKQVVYPFGYGLSYTTFDLGTPAMRVDGDDIVVETTVTNTGEFDGKEVVQVYFSAPQGKLGKPAKELAGYAKTALLKPGESESVEVRFPISEMSSYDDLGKVQKAAYVLEAGEYQIFLGNSIRDARTRAVGAYTVSADRVVEQLSTKLQPAELPERLLADGSYEKMPSRLVTKIEADPYKGIQIEAENYKKAHWGVKKEVFAVGEDEGVALTHMTDFLNTYATYELDVEEGGDYYVLMRAANGYHEIKDMAKIFVNGVEQKSLTIAMPKTGDGILKGEWHNYVQVEPFVVKLPAGRVELKIQSKNRGFANLDHFTIIKTRPDAVATQVADRTANTTSGENIQLIDVYRDRSLMNAFVQQLSDYEIAHLLTGRPMTLMGGTGGVGDLPKYGIPNAQTSDGPAGIRLMSESTAWPSASLQASTWNTALVEKGGYNGGLEALSKKVDIWLTPGMNIHRDPLNGRNFEYYSEDPLLTGEMALYLTKGIQRSGVLATLKHYIVNNKETNRNASDSRVSERALREIYLKGFEIAVKGTNVRNVMTSYNYINGIETAENRELNIDILRGEWSFDGLVMTDWLNQTQTYTEAYAGNDLKMPFGFPHTTYVLDGLGNQKISREILNRNAVNVLNVIMDTPLFRTTNGLPLFGQ